MDKVYQSLLYATAARSDRQKAANLVLAHPDRLKTLLHHCFSDEKIISQRACWVLEFVCYRHLDWILPELNVFLNGIRELKNESSIRPVAKVCELLAEEYTYGYPNFDLVLTEEQIRKLVVQCFDWLMGDHKVATKAYSMQSIYYLHNFESWITPQLTQILQEQRGDHSAAYKARSRNLLQKLKQI